MTIGRSTAAVALLLVLGVALPWTAQPQALGTNPGVAGATRFVATFNGRTGAVIAITGDYSFSQLSGAATAGQIPSLQFLNGQLNLSQIPQAGATTGQALCWSGSWAPCTIAGGGGGGGGGDSPAFVEQIQPTGTVDGVNIYFSIPDVPNPVSSLYVWVNGVLMCSSAAAACPSGVDYVISGNTFFFNSGSVPQPPANVLASYRH